MTRGSQAASLGKRQRSTQLVRLSHGPHWRMLHMRPRTESVELPGRVRLAYVEHGEPSGVPMLMLHGITDSWRSFEPVLPRLPASIHTFALSLRGHGDSDRPASGYQPDDF